MNIVVDTNVIVAALIRAGIVREVLLSHPGVFSTPPNCLAEAWEKRGEWNRTGIPDPIVRETLDLLAKRVLVVVPESAFGARTAEAPTLIDDPDDVPVVALALATGSDGIWTFNTRDFGRAALVARVRVLTTRDVIGVLAGFP